MTAVALEAPECELGYPEQQLRRMFGDQGYQRLMLWMRGQTMGLCEGRRYDHKNARYVQTGCGPHGPAVYAWDVRRWAEAGPIVD